MFIDYNTFCQRAGALQQRIAAACHQAGRDPAQVSLLPVTKTHPAAAADYAARYGLPAVGENACRRPSTNAPRPRPCSAGS